MKILLIEPDTLLGGILRTQLEKAGHVVTVCKSAQTALDAVDTMPEVIVLEVQLGLHNGIEFLYELRSYPEWQQIPVIIHTMNSHMLESQFVEPLHDLGVEAVLYKPKTPTEQLLEAISLLAVPS